MTLNFYSELEAFRDFEAFTETRHYREVPGDWYVYITDVVNSTEAIDRGLYKEVNLIGAASITLCIRLLKDLAFPFVFGGDGASLCIPGEKRAAVDAELGSLARLAERNFGLQLRVARMPVSELVQQGKRLLVAKFALVGGNTLAFFRGGGLELAEKLAKSRFAQYRIPPASHAVEELAGLSCRWSPIPANKGCVVSLLVKSRDGDAAQAYAALIGEFRTVMGETLDEANPVKLEKARYKSLFGAVADEYRYHRSPFSPGFLKRLVEIVLAVVIFRHGMRIGGTGFDARHYMESLARHSDYRKFDDTLRLVLDCTGTQAEALRQCLEKYREAGAIWYGMYKSKEALMTCFVETMQDGGHLHFIDGGNGGLAMAAKQLKSQVT